MWVLPEKYRISKVAGSCGLIPAIRPNSKNPSKKWGSCPSISPEAVSRCQSQDLRSSRPNGDASFLGCPALVQRDRPFNVIHQANMDFQELAPLMFKPNQNVRPNLYL
jgi:hypothetical protein